MSARVLVPAAVAMVLLSVGCEGNSVPGQVGSRIPEYQAMDLDGELVSLDAYRGSPVLLNVWATWCPPCRTEIPELNTLQEQWGERGLKVVGISLDAVGTGEEVREFLEEFQVGYDILRDPHEVIARELGVVGMPTTVLLDAEGVIRWRHMGAVTADDPGLEKALSQVIE